MRQVVIAVMFVLAVPVAAFAQRAQRSATFAYEIAARERWLNARQKADLIPTSQSTTWVYVDDIAIDSAANTRTLRATVVPAVSDAQAQLVSSLDGRLLNVTAQLRERPIFASFERTWRDTLRARRSLVTSWNGDILTLPEARIWDLVPRFTPRRPVAGAHWLDTLAHEAAYYGMRQAFRGIRRYTIVRDTVIDGRQLWIVRDTAQITYDERLFVDERRLSSVVTIDRHGRGFISGRSIYDPATGLIRARTDTTVIRGDALLRYPDGRTFRSATRYERGSKWTSYDRGALAARQRAIAAAQDSDSFSIVMVPHDGVEERIAAHDAHTIDSLVRFWTATRNPDQRDAIDRTLRMWVSNDSVTQRRIDAMHAAVGDVPYALTHRSYVSHHRITVDQVRLYLPFMRDPGLAFQYGVSRDILYENMVEPLVRAPPSIVHDTADWPCEPAACALLGEQWRKAKEPRLRAVGLSALALTDPRRWRDTFLLFAAKDSSVTNLAVGIVSGSGRRGTLGTARGGIPAENADWLTWLDWLDVPRPNAPQPPPGFAGARPRWQTDMPDSTTVRYMAAALGRDLGRELRRQFDAAPNDTARVVLANVLVAATPNAFSLDAIAALIRGGSPLMRDFAKRRLYYAISFGGASSVGVRELPDSLAASLQDQLLAAFVNRREPWRTLEEKESGRDAAAFRNPPSDAPGATHPVYYASDELDASVRAQWGKKLRMMTKAEWNARPSREGGELWTVTQPKGGGPFAIVQVDVSGRIARSSAHGPQAWASWTTYVLLVVDGEWVVVSRTSMVT